MMTVEEPRPDDASFQPDYRIRAIIPKRPKKPSSYGKHGGLTRTVMDALRQSPAAITARELASTC
jgi:hypothetical protein